jgi:hypothetical protein
MRATKRCFRPPDMVHARDSASRPAVLVIDVSFNFCGDRPEPILESIRRWPNSCGEDAWIGIAEIRRLVEATRAKVVPAIYTTGAFRRDQWDVGGWSWKNSRTNEWSASPRPSGKPAELPVEASVRFELVIIRPADDILDPFNRIGRPLRTASPHR